MRAGVAFTAALGALLLVALPAVGAEHIVSADGDALRRTIAEASPGDVLRLRPGTHRGDVVIDKSLTVMGEPGARIEGGGQGRVVTLDAPGIVLKGVTVTGSGLSLATEDSGIFVTRRAHGVTIEDNRLEDNLIGVYLKGPKDAMVRGNVIRGRQDLRMNERGNGVQIWRSPGSVVDGNDIRHGRDGIFVTTSKRNVFRDNRFADLRFAIHYMYTNDSVLAGNRSHGNHVGYALMYSRRLQVTGNVSEGDRDHGILLNYTNRSRISGNTVRHGPHKCVFIYNANKNAIRGNRFEGCDIGVHFTAGSERNVIADNAFVANRNQVKYVGSRHVEWSKDGRGNFWSDNTAYDLDGDGIGDAPYRPNDLVDQIVWRHPLAKLLLNSPALQILRWSQSAFPAVLPGGVTDSHPLMGRPAADAAVAGG